jgi:arylsulfatase A-like enzyme
MRLLVGAFLLAVLAGPGHTQDPAARPNILWITCEDTSPTLGCYGDSYAVTPNLDLLAAQGVRYTHAYAPIGVCAPARSSLILGMYACSAGTHPMRCQGTLPASVRCYSETLREAGYYCTNNAKTDYNFQHPKSAWDDCSNKGHWRNRPKNRPFFSIFNILSTHEGQIRLGEGERLKRNQKLSPEERHDPAKAPVPPYHPDTPEVRADWAHYYDNVTLMDKQSGEILKELEADGLASDTIVFFYGDHGAGMPRSKRWLYESSLRVPLLIRFPEKFRKLAPGEPGSTVDRLVNFVDFGPTLLSLVGANIPVNMQGKPFLGDRTAPPAEYMFGFRDRMDERYDMIRTARDKRYRYIRNFMPHVTWAQHISYLYQMSSMKVWQRLSDEGKLSGPQAVFFSPVKPVEELYDTEADPHEVKNLAADPAHRGVLERMRKALREWMIEIRDLGFLPEADLRTRFKGEAPYEAVRARPDSYPLERLMEAADLANRIDPAVAGKLEELLRDGDSAVRYWGATGLAALGEKARPAEEALRKSLGDAAPDVRIAAADALCRLGRLEEALPALGRALKHENEWARLRAANVIDALGARAAPLRAEIQAAARDKNNYVGRVIEHALGNFKP